MQNQTNRSSAVNLQPTSKAIPKPANAGAKQPHYQPSTHKQTEKRPAPVKQNLPKKSVVAPASIISGSELEELRAYNRRMQNEREQPGSAQPQ